MGAYTHDVTPSLHGGTGEAAASPGVGKRRRRPPNQAEQSRREAWGHKWGEIMAAHARQLRGKGAK